MRQITLGPFNRVEGDLEVHLAVREERIVAAQVNSPLFRGFEQILEGKAPSDALVITPRICGICSVAQSMAAAAALADAMQLQMPRNGELVTNLILASENLADHLSHFYLFFMPDFAREAYAARPWHEHVAARFRALSGSAAAEVLRARAEFLHLMGTLAGKWPHTLTLQPGGSSRAVEPGERLRLLALLAQFRRFLEQRLYGDSLERIAALSSREELEAWRTRAAWHQSDLRTFLHLAEQLDLYAVGRGSERYLSYGAYPLQQERLFARGVWDRGAARSLDLAAIAEDISHSWMQGDKLSLPPAQGRTHPDENRPGAYSWCKAPRLNGEVMEVGALARQLVDGQSLIRDLVARGGGSVATRVIARLLEIARVLLAMEDWLRALQSDKPYCAFAKMPIEAQGVGLVEAARGSLGHWLRVHKGRIANYQIIAPTTWNFSPRDAQGVPGALEQALVGVPMAVGEEDPVLVQHIVRSFDPCMVCTVH